MVESRLHWKCKNQEASLSATLSSSSTCILCFFHRQQKQYILGKYTDQVNNDVLRSIYTEGLKEEVYDNTVLGGVDSLSLDYIGKVGIRMSLYQPSHQPPEHVYCVSSIGDKNSISQANILVRSTTMSSEIQRV